MSGLFSLPENSFPSLKLVNENKIAGEHFGYSVPHKRTFTILEKKLIIQDVMDSSKPKLSNLNFHPSVTCVIENAENEKVECVLKNNSGVIIRLHMNGMAHPVIKPGFYSKGYGQSIHTNRLEVQMLAREAKIEFNW